MATYKVPQDVEAEDKLIGWLSFRQLIYAGIAVAAAAVGFFMFQVFPPLIIIPLPIVLLFGILILPLRKDQPLETYLIAVVRFYLNPKIRHWDPDGVISYVEITAPVLAEPQLAKEYGAEGAQERLDYLARVMDSRGWALKELPSAPSGINLRSDVAAEVNSVVDVLDEGANLSRTLQSLIQRKSQEQRQTAMERMQHAQSEPTSAATSGPVVTMQVADEPTVAPTYNPYPASMHQKVIMPASQQPKNPPKPAAQPATNTMTPPVSPDIIRLATSNDLSVSVIAHEAERLEAKNNDDEVVIKLR